MTDRTTSLIEKLNREPENLRLILEEMEYITNPSPEEKTILAKALISYFSSLESPRALSILRLANDAKKQLTRFGPDIAPLLIREMAGTDIESAAYLGKVLARMGKAGLDCLLSGWDNSGDDEAMGLHVIQALSYYTTPDVREASPRVMFAARHQHSSIRAKALETIAKWIGKSHEIGFDVHTRKTFADLAFELVSDTHPLVRTNAVTVLGQMVRRRLLPAAHTSRVQNLLQRLSGKDEGYSWDEAFIVRRESEKFLRYFAHMAPVANAYIQSFRIVEKRMLCTGTFHYSIDAPYIARRIQAGQFIMVRPHEMGERIPLSICGWDRDAGTIQIIVATVGRTSMEINGMNVGDRFRDVVGPLGERSHIPETNGTCVVIGGGYGTGAIMPTARDLKERGNRVIGIVGARSRANLIMVEELQDVCDVVLVATNDGSAGREGLVTDVLREVVTTSNVIQVLAVGPVPMMKAVGELTRPLHIRTYVSLNAIMVDGTGMCGACRVSVGDSTKFACIHGPDFDAHLVDFENLMKRQKMFVKEEKIAYDMITQQKHEACDAH